MSHSYQRTCPKLIISAFLLIATFPLLAQISYAIHYGPNDGLPSNEIYELAQDYRGRIWFASDNGISSFDGYAFQNIPPLPQITYNSFVRLFTGANGRLWFLSYQGKLAFLHNDSIVPYLWNNIIAEKGILQVMSTIWVDSCDRIFFKAKDPGRIIQIDSNRNISEFDNPSYPLSLYTSFYHNYSPDKDTFPKLPAFNPFGNAMQNPATLISQSLLVPNPNRNPVKVYKTGNRSLFLDSDNVLVNIQLTDPNRYSVTVDSFNIFQESNGNIWLRKESGGVVLYKKGDLNSPLTLFKETRVTRMMKDRESNYWIATEGNGVYMLPESSLRIYGYDIGLDNLNIIDLTISNDEIYFSTGDNRLYTAKVSGDRLTQVKEMITDEKDKYGRDILFDSDGQLWLVHSKYLRYKRDGVPDPPFVIPLVKLNRIIETRNKEKVLATNQGFFVYKGSQLIYDSRSDQFYRHVQAIHEDVNGHLWLGTMDGLFEFHEGKYTNWQEKDSMLANPVTAITSVGEYVMFGLRSGKVIIMNNNKNRIIDQSDGLTCDQILAMTFHGQSDLWLSTNQGLYRITFTDSAFTDYVISRFTIWNGIPSNKINAISFDRERIWAASSEGLVTLIPGDLERKVPEPKLFIEGISIDDSTIYTGDPIYLSSAQRTFTIRYKGISFHDPGNLFYRYRFTGSDDKWIETKSVSLRFRDLKPGKYKFELQCRNADGNYSDSTVSATFLIPKFFYETLLFRVAFAIIVMFLIILLVFLFMKNRQRKTDMRNRLLNAEFKALRLQMNPHFIFNVLNSINHYITENKPEPASRYLKSFARLMRKVLENSRQNTVSLEEESKTLDEYLSLEQMRFEHKFNYRIIMDPQIQPMDIFIPPMLIQPFLENAIWHGLLHKESTGELRIEFLLKYGKNLKVIIEDNGIGRVKSKEISSQRKGRKSAGIELITERINLINQMNKTDINLNITDLYDSRGNATGTRVELNFPNII